MFDLGSLPLLLLLLHLYCNGIYFGFGFGLMGLSHWIWFEIAIGGSIKYDIMI